MQKRQNITVQDQQKKNIYIYTNRPPKRILTFIGQVSIRQVHDPGIEYLVEEVFDLLLLISGVGIGAAGEPDVVVEESSERRPCSGIKLGRVDVGKETVQN